MDSSVHYAVAPGTDPRSLTFRDRTSSTHPDQSSSTSQIELVSLVSNTGGLPKKASHHDATDVSDAFSSIVTTTKTTRKRLQKTAPSLIDSPPFIQDDRPSTISRLLVDTWLYEAAAMSLSIICLVAIALIVRAYDGEAIPSIGITLNTIVSVLSTTARSSLIFVVSAMIGQLKWPWLQRAERRMWDVQTMDDASRGPLGAIRMLMFWTGGSLAAFGGIITLLTIAFSPFLQQLLDYPSRNVTQPTPYALAPQVLAYTGLFVNNTAITNLSSILEAGTWSTPKSLDQDASCPTGRCSWDTFKSVGWCTKCEDRRDLATIHHCNLQTYLADQNRTSSPRYCALDLGNGGNISLLDEGPRNISSLTTWSLEINYTSEVIWPVSYGGFAYGKQGPTADTMTPRYPNQDPFLYGEETSFMGVRDPLMVFGHANVSVNSDIFTPYVTDVELLGIDEASLCVLTLCEKEMFVLKEAGLTHWSEGSTNYGSVFGDLEKFPYTKVFGFAIGEMDIVPETDERDWYYNSICWQPQEGQVALTGVDEVHLGLEVNVTQAGVDEVHLGFWNLQNNLTDLTFVDKDRRAFCPVELLSGSVEPYLVGKTTKAITFNDNNSDLLYKFAHSSQTSSSSSDTVGPGSTRTLSERLKSIAIALTNYGLATTNDTVTGYAVSSETYVHVRWQWVIPPVLLELATLLLFILTIVHSRRKGVPIWKSSVLAIIYHSVEDLQGQETLATERLSDMEAAAKATAVQLAKREESLTYLSARPGRRVAAEEQEG